MSQFTLEGYQIFEKNSSYETGVATCLHLYMATNNIHTQYKLQNSLLFN